MFNHLSIMTTSNGIISGLAPAIIRADDRYLTKNYIFNLFFYKFATLSNPDF